jgi:hypothetical protein
MAKARKFKRRLAQKTTRAKNEPVLSINILGKEYIEKLNNLGKKISSLVKSLKLKKYVTR